MNMVIQEMVKIHATWFCVIAKTLKEVESEYRNVVIKELKKTMNILNIIRTLILEDEFLKPN